MAVAARRMAGLDSLAPSKLDAAELRNLRDMLLMRLHLIDAQAATTRRQIVVMGDALKRAGAPPPTRRRPRARRPRTTAAAPAHDAQCTVCLEELAADAVDTDCGHGFHQACIDRWAAETYPAPSCPVCRRQLFAPD